MSGGRESINGADGNRATSTKVTVATDVSGESEWSRGKRCDIDAAKRRSQTENWEVRVNQSKPKLTNVRIESQTHKITEIVPGGNTSGGSRDG